MDKDLKGLIKKQKPKIYDLNQNWEAPTDDEWKRYAKIIHIGDIHAPDEIGGTDEDSEGLGNGFSGSEESES